ncbi:family 20 glycosylhydrolase [Chitinophaga oryzae]|uniref:beta-N-acetylhexosaminidase n=1 Tax=Chitinophaga oryzae TaxID=2725414 RepID=A0AAE7D8U1_9BACT|nr:family 20 glycosylhydrolase [Chitinophaga oryzae]QJB32493.1 family 20 glycosylhydrolase [Chitinophaga oryzae]
MKRVFLFSVLITVHTCLLAQRKRVAAPAALIPLPVAASWTADSAFVTAHAEIKAMSGLEKDAALLKSYMERVGSRPVSNRITAAVILSIDSVVVKQPEGYLLQVTPQQVKLTAHDAAGIGHGIATLQQLWKPAAGGGLVLPGAMITDYPRFGYRGMHLDVSRHFFSVDYIKQFIDQLALYKFNNFHWHLTDDQGWRIEIKKYPRLQEVSAWRDQTMIGHKKELPHRFDGKKYGGYYTQEQVKEVVAYAAARHINVIPEIEMPGHALAALEAFPALGCTGGPYKTAQFWGIFDDVFCAGKDSTFLFLQDVLDEVIALFPSSYIHIGGDECPKVRWKQCPACQQRMKAEHLEDEDALQSYFIRRISDYVNRKGRKIIGWDEILEGGLAPGATVMSWRGVEGAVMAARQKQQVIMTPEDELYFDHYQSLYPEEQTAAAGYTPLEAVYGYEPLVTAGDTALLPYIAGIQGGIWSEYLSTETKANYMIYPRLQATAERAWSPATVRDYDDFTQRLTALTGDRYTTWREINYKLDSVGRGSLYVTLHARQPGAVVRYTTDGSVPVAGSPVYKGRIRICHSAVLQARLFVQGKPAGRLFRQPFEVYKSTGARVTLQQPPNTKYTSDAALLVNGVAGTHRFNDGQWLGFSARDLHAYVDLGSVQEIKLLGANVLNYHWQKMWAPESLVFEVSADGKNFERVVAADSFPVNGTNQVRLTVKPVQARYIKVTAVNKGVIPAGEYGAGGRAMMLADEIIVN